MLCNLCQVAVARRCRSAMGFPVPMNALGCDFDGLCNVQEYSEKIIHIFKNQDIEVKKEDGK